MKITTDSITLNGVTYEATQIDYNSYQYEVGYWNNFQAVKVYGVEGPPPIEKVIVCADDIYCSNTLLVGSKKIYY